MKEISVGQKVYVGNIERNEYIELKECVIKKIGKKYFYVNIQDGTFQDWKFELNTSPNLQYANQVVDGGAPLCLYLTMEDAYFAKDWSYLKREMEYFANKLTLEEKKNVYDIFKRVLKQEK